MALEGHGGQHGAALRGHLLLAPICLHGDPTVPSSPCPGLCLTLIQRTALLPRLRRPRPSLAASELSPPALASVPEALFPARLTPHLENEPRTPRPAIAQSGLRADGSSGPAASH